MASEDNILVFYLTWERVITVLYLPISVFDFELSVFIESIMIDVHVQQQMLPFINCLIGSSRW